MKLLRIDVNAPPGVGVPAAFETALREKAGAVFIRPDEPMFFTNRALIVEYAARHRLPAFYGAREFVDAGGLMSYGENHRTAYRNAASYIGKVVQGSKPGDIPLAQPNGFELVVDKATARTLGITLPQSLMLRANDVIE